ncbi:beta-lactamase family protein [Polyangium aurulentum]|nr:beta-lactamase family protein [Polyangium aurulentum]
MLLAGACAPCPPTAPCPQAPSTPPPPASTNRILTPATPESVGMSTRRLEDVFARIEQRVKDNLFPGAVALVARHGRIVGHRAFGNKTRGGNEPVTLDTIFDLESMTKVLATAISALVLVQLGKMRLDDPVVRYLPAFTGEGKDRVTVADMLRYSAGLPVDNQFLDVPDRDEVFRRMAETPLEYPPGTKAQYSDLTYRLLGRVIEAAADASLYAFASEHVWKPLGMFDTLYTPPPALVPRIAATGHSSVRQRVVRGEVQDEQDYALGGVCGCDGVFSTAKDVATFAQMILDGGTYAGVRVLDAKLAAAMVRNQTPWTREEETDVSPMSNLLFTPKGYGWELFTSRFSNGGTRLMPGSFGKIGGAGTVFWIDPHRKLVAVLLTNHGLPVPFDEPNWNQLIYTLGSGEFFDGVVNAVIGHA